MKFLNKIALFLVAIIFTASCTTKETVTPATTKNDTKNPQALKDVLTNAKGARSIGSIQLGVPFEIGMGDIRYSLSEYFAIRLDKAVDARCPQGTYCIQAGGAKVSFSAFNGSFFNFALETSNALAGTAPLKTSFNGYTLELLTVAPYPVAGTETPQSSYRVTLVLTKDTPVTGIELGTPFELELGANNSFSKGSMSFEFREVREDSRCPEGVNCITAGKATLLFIANGTQKIELTSEAGKPELARDVYKGHTLELLAVRGDATKGYKATLVLVQNPVFDLNTNVDIAYNQSVNVGGLDLTFSGVSDSRCPEGTTCVWAGNVQATFKSGKYMVRLTLEAGQPELARTIVNGYHVTLEKITPTPQAGVAANKADYKVQLVVTK